VICESQVLQATLALAPMFAVACACGRLRPSTCHLPSFDDALHAEVLNKSRQPSPASYSGAFEPVSCAGSRGGSLPSI
jgi:hypothetical protein